MGGTKPRYRWLYRPPRDCQTTGTHTNIILMYNTQPMYLFLLQFPITLPITSSIATLGCTNARSQESDKVK